MFVVFRLHEGSYGLPLENVSEVVRMVAITSVPRAPEWLLGVINVRGRVVPIIDLRLRLGLSPRTAELNTPVIVVQVKGRIVGLVVDRTEEVISLPPEAITPPDDLTVRARPVQAVANRNGELILILDLPRVVAGTEHFSTEPMPKGKHEPSKSKV
jgi:purine-binding chemotaxis protein CheW